MLFCAVPPLALLFWRRVVAEVAPLIGGNGLPGRRPRLCGGAVELRILLLIDVFVGPPPVDVRCRLGSGWIRQLVEILVPLRRLELPSPVGRLCIARTPGLLGILLHVG